MSTSYIIQKSMYDTLPVIRVSAGETEHFFKVASTVGQVNSSRHVRPTRGATRVPRGDVMGTAANEADAIRRAADLARIFERKESAIKQINQQHHERVKGWMEAGDVTSSSVEA